MRILLNTLLINIFKFSNMNVLNILLSNQQTTISNLSKKIVADEMQRRKKGNGLLSDLQLEKIKAKI